MNLKIKRIKKWINPHAVIVTLLIWGVIFLLNFIRLNLHFFDPFNNGLKNYEITDIVTSRFRDKDKINLDLNIVLVNTGKPDRLELAKLIDRINQFSPKVIGVDILLNGKKDQKIDSLLAEKIKESPNIVLADQLQNFNDSLKVFDAPVGCDTTFSKYAQTGFVNFVSKDNFTIRLFNTKVNTVKGEHLAFPVKITELAEPNALKKLWRRNKKSERIHYLGDKNSFVKFEAKQLLDTTQNPGASIKDKIVLVGYLGNNEWNKPMKDRFFTPLNEQYAGRSLPDMFGLVIHANIISMIINDNYIYDVPDWLAFLLELVFCYANVLLVFWVYKRFPEPFHSITRGLQIVEFVLVFLLIAVLFHNFEIRIDFETGILTLVLAYDFVMIYESMLKKKIKMLRQL